MDPRVGEWYPNRTTIVLWTIFGSLLSVAGVLLFAAVYSFTHGSAEFKIEGSLNSILVLVGLFLSVILLGSIHEWVHGLAMRGYRVRPEYGAGFFMKLMPYLYCTAPGHKFTKWQFATVSVAPAVVISLVGAVCVAFVPYGGWLVIPLGFHLGGCVGDLWFLGMIARQPQGTVIEDLRTGVRFHRPAVWSSMLDSRL